MHRRATRSARRRFVRESMSNRLNDEQSAIVVIMQRLQEGDVPGDIISREANCCHMVFRCTSTLCGTPPVPTESAQTSMPHQARRNAAGEFPRAAEQQRHSIYGLAMRPRRSTPRTTRSCAFLNQSPRHGCHAALGLGTERAYPQDRPPPGGGVPRRPHRRKFVRRRGARWRHLPTYRGAAPSPL